MAKLIPSELEGASPTPRQIFDHLDQFVIGQDRAKRALSIAAYNHFKRLASLSDPLAEDEVPLKKSNILFVGPSGCGKTHLARNLSSFLNVPFAVVAAT